MNKLLLSLIIFFAVERFCHWQTDGFMLSKMVFRDEPVRQQGGMKLTLIGAGKQYYAFETPDHQYVVKFMKFSRRRPLPWLEKIPLPKLLTEGYLAERAKRLSQLQKSGSLAARLLSEETGIVSSSFLPQFVTLIDKLGIEHTVDLDQTQFYVQKKAVLFPAYFTAHPAEAESLIASYIATIASHCCKGISNLDPVLEKNFGIANGRLIVLDFGSLLANSKLRNKTRLQREIFVELLPLRHWLQQHDPDRVPIFDHQLKETLFHAIFVEQQEASL